MPSRERHRLPGAALVRRASRTGARRTLVAGAKRATKVAATPIIAAARASGWFRLATAAIHADELLASRGANDGVASWERDLSEPRRSLSELGAGDPCPTTTPVSTRLTILDGPRGSFAFCDNHVVDDRLRIVIERARSETGHTFTFRDLHAWWAPLDRPRRISGTVAYLSNTGVHNFGHWLLFVYPLVKYYRDYLGAEPDYYYLGAPIQRWHYDTLAKVGIEPDRILADAVTGDRMLACLADWTIPPPTAFLDFSTEMLRKARDQSAPRRRVYISRAMRPTRRPFLNEGECMDVLAEHGFDAYYTETLTLEEETELFASAEVVVALHGAGLANLLFCHPGTVVVELFPHGYTSEWFAEVSAVRQITYANLYGEATETTGLSPPEHPVLVDPEKLDAVLTAATKADAETRGPIGYSEPTPRDLRVS